MTQNEEEVASLYAQAEEARSIARDLRKSMYRGCDNSVDLCREIAMRTDMAKEYEARASDLEKSAPTDGVQASQEVKRDAGKPDYTLLPLSAWTMGLSAEDLLGVVRVREWFIRNGGHRDSWKQVEGIRWRAAAERHRQAIHRGESLDPESGLPHRHHYLTSVAFLLSKGVES